MMKENTDVLRQIDEQAAAWHDRVYYNQPDRETLISFEVWLQESSLHRERYNKVKSFSDKLELYVQAPVVKELYPASDVLVAEVEESSAVPAGKGKFHLRGLAIAACFALFALVVGFSALNGFWLYDLYETGKGQKQTITLADGSQVVLNTGSLLQVDYGARGRRLTLLRGQGYFDVVPDKERPFVVTFEGGQVKALGTDFDVYLRGHQAEVSLLGGSVQVARQKPQTVWQKVLNTTEQQEVITLDMTKGPVQVKLSPYGLGQTEPIDHMAATAWQNDMLMFDNRSLGYVLDELKRYSSKMISMEDPEMKDIIISGAFPTNVPAALEMLEAYFNVRVVQEKSNEIMLVSARTSQKN